MEDDIQVIEEENNESEKSSAFRGEAFKSIISVILLSAVVFGAAYYFIDKKYAIGPVLVLLSIIPVVILKVFGKPLGSIWADFAFGSVSTGLIGLVSLTGLNIASMLGTSKEASMAGIAIANMIIIGFAGIFEGKISYMLSEKSYATERTPLGSSIGKMSGCLFGIGLVLTIAWTIMGL